GFQRFFSDFGVPVREDLILEMRLSRLTGLERRWGVQGAGVQIDFLEGILGDEAKLMKVVDGFARGSGVRGMYVACRGREAEPDLGLPGAEARGGDGGGDAGGVLRGVASGIHAAVVAATHDHLPTISAPPSSPLPTRSARSRSTIPIILWRSTTRAAG